MATSMLDRACNYLSHRTPTTQAIIPPDNWVARYHEVRHLTPGMYGRNRYLVSYSIAPVYCGTRVGGLAIGFTWPKHRARNRQARENRLRRLEALARGLAARLTR